MGVDKYLWGLRLEAGYGIGGWLAGLAGAGGAHYSRHSGGECIGHKTRADQGRLGGQSRWVGQG